MSKEFCHIELNTPDLDGAKSFYQKMFGWKLISTPMEQGEYVVIQPESGPGGGMFRVDEEQHPYGWTPYMLVKDIDAEIERAQELGAKVVVPRHEIEGMGILAMFTDPQGVKFALWQSTAENQSKE
jgi:predicted enzyme related to lactoylglutathione lyase